MISVKGTIAAAIATVLLFALTPRAAAQSSTAFDGNWWVTMGAQDYENPNNRGLTHAFEFHFPATATHGILHGERGTRRVLFKGSRGTGNSVGARVRIFHFTKK